MIIEYSNNGTAFSDFDIEECILLLKNSTNINVSTDNFINRARALHREKKVKIEYFIFKGQKIRVDVNGEVEDYPEGFCDTQNDSLLRLI